MSGYFESDHVDSLNLEKYTEQDGLNVRETGQPCKIDQDG